MANGPGAASVNGNTVDLTLTKAASVLDSVISTGNNPAQGAAQVLDNVLGADPNGELASNFVGLTSEQERAAFHQPPISPAG